MFPDYFISVQDTFLIWVSSYVFIKFESKGEKFTLILFSSLDNPGRTLEISIVLFEWQIFSHNF